MGTTSCNEVKYVNKKRNEIDLLQNDVINSFPLPLLLLSLIKIKEIKKLLNKYQDIIEKDKNLKLLRILSDINKSTKLLKDYANKFEKLLSPDLLNIKGIEIYDFALKQINNEMKIIDNNFNQNLLLNLFYFNVNILCSKCQKKTDNFHCLLLNSYMFGTEPCEDILYCNKCNSKTQHLISSNSYPKIIILFNKNLNRID